MAKRGGAGPNNGAMRGCRAPARGFGRLHHRIFTALSGAERGATAAAAGVYLPGAAVPTVLLMWWRPARGPDRTIHSAAGAGIVRGRCPQSTSLSTLRACSGST